MGQAFQGQEGTCPKYRYANRKGFTLLLLLSLLHDLIGIYSFWYFEVNGHLEEFLESQSIVPLFRWILLKRTDERIESVPSIFSRRGFVCICPMAIWVA